MSNLDKPSSTSAEQLLTGSDILGWADFWMGSLPSGGESRTLLTETTGGGSVSTSATGTTISPGSTSGDTADVRYDISLRGRYNYDPGMASKVIIDFVAETNVGYTDDIRLGAVGVNTSDSSTYFDFTAEQVNVGGTTASFNYPTGFATRRFRMTVDLPAGETTFEMEGATTDSVTINDALAPREIGILTSSNGSGDTIYVMESTCRVIR